MNVFMYVCMFIYVRPFVIFTNIYILSDYLVMCSTEDSIPAFRMTYTITIHLLYPICLNVSQGQGYINVSV